MNQEQQDALRAPFPEGQIGKLPKVTCGACSKAQYRVCDKHQRSKCKTCGSYMTGAHIHLDFVGHADLTDRLLAVDPEWDWEPMAVDEEGLPKFDRLGGMWITLTVAGVTRKGYGHPDGKQGGDAIKETIGDALRNAGMRFGIALDLWKKEPIMDSFHPSNQKDAPPQNTPTEPDTENSAEDRGEETSDGPAVDVQKLNEWQGWLDKAKTTEDLSERLDRLQKVHSKASQIDGIKGATAFFAAIENAIHEARAEQANEPRQQVQVDVDDAQPGQEPSGDGTGEDELSDTDWENMISEAEEDGDAESLGIYVETLAKDKGDKHRLTGIARAALKRANSHTKQAA